MAWQKIASKGDIPSGGGKEFNVEGKRIAVFNQDGYHALMPYACTKMVR